MHYLIKRNEELREENDHLQKIMGTDGCKTDLTVFPKTQGISNSTFTRLRRDEAVSTETINKLCTILECKVEDIMEYLNKP